MPGFWDEPVNAFSNIVFLIAAWLALRVAVHRPTKDYPEIFVILLAGSIGIGSFLFHTLANARAELADVIPIWSFVAAFVLISIYRITAENLTKTLRIAGIVVGVTLLMFWFTSKDITTDAVTTPDMFNGSLQYLPALLALIIFSILTQLRRNPVRGYMVLATLVFTISLTFRSIDLISCDSTVIGTHFVWHVLNGIMIGLLLQALVLKMPPLSSLQR